MATAVVKGESSFMTSMLIKKAKAVASVANNNRQSSRGTPNGQRKPCLERNKAASTTAALSNSTRVNSLNRGSAQDRIERSKHRSQCADTNANPTPR